MSVVVGPNVMRQVQALHFTMPYGGANPLPQVLPIFSTGTAFDVVVTASTATGGNWLSVSGCGAYCVPRRRLSQPSTLQRGCRWVLMKGRWSPGNTTALWPLRSRSSSRLRRPGQRFSMTPRDI